MEANLTIHGEKQSAQGIFVLLNYFQLLTSDFCSSHMQIGRPTNSNAIYRTTTSGRIHLLQFPQEQGIFTRRRWKAFETGCKFGDYSSNQHTLDTFNSGSALVKLQQLFSYVHVRCLLHQTIPFTREDKGPERQQLI